MGDADGHKSDGQGYKRTLQHARVKVASKIVGAQQVETERRRLFRRHHGGVVRRQGRQQFLCEAHRGGVDHRVGAPGQQLAAHRHRKQGQ